jgi:hypothetical protein
MLERLESESKSELYDDRRSVGQPFLVSGTHLGLATNFFFVSLLLRVVDVGRPLCREVWSVVYA